MGNSFETFTCTHFPRTRAAARMLTLLADQTLDVPLMPHIASLPLSHLVQGMVVGRGEAIS